MARVAGRETVIISHRQSFTKYAIAANTVFHTVQDKLSNTPTSFLCSMSTHSTAVEKKTKNITTLQKFKSQKIFSAHILMNYSGLW